MPRRMAISGRWPRKMSVMKALRMADGRKPMARARWTRPASASASPSSTSASMPAIGKRLRHRRGRAIAIRRCAGRRPASAVRVACAAAISPPMMRPGEIGEIVVRPGIGQQRPRPHREERGEERQAFADGAPHGEREIGRGREVAAVSAPPNGAERTCGRAGRTARRSSPSGNRGWCRRRCSPISSACRA